MVLGEGIGEHPLYQIQSTEIVYGTEGALSVAANYREGTDGKLILFLHGIGGNKDVFRDVWESEEFKDASLLVPDLIGFGQSSSHADFSYDLWDQAAVLKNLLRHYSSKDKELHLVAHSMGAAIGTLLTAQLSELQSFQNIDGNLIPGDGGLLSRGTIEVGENEFVQKRFGQIKQRLAKSDSVGARLWVAQSASADPHAFYRSADSLVKWSDSGGLIALYSRLLMRKQFIFGEKDTGMPILSVLQPNETLAIPNSGHFPMNDNPKAFYPAIAAFIQRK